MSPRGKDGHFQHAVPFPAADGAELRIDQIIIPGKGEQLLERARENFGRAIYIPIGEVKKKATFQVV